MTAAPRGRLIVAVAQHATVMAVDDVSGRDKEQAKQILRRAGY